MRVLLALAMVPWGWVAADTKEPSKAHLSIELNRLDPVTGACRASFVIANKLGTGLGALGFEIVLFGKDERLLQLISFPAGALPKGKTVVRRFDIAGVPCDTIGRALLNAIPQCDGEGLDPATCLRRVRTTSRAGIELA